MYVKLPPFWGDDGAPILNEDQGGSSPRLLSKGIPGIPQGSRLFYETFRDHLAKLGHCASDCCLYFNANLKERHALAIWVDDFLFAYEKEETFHDLITELKKKFNVTTGDCAVLS